MKIQEIGKGIKFDNDGSVQQALERMRDVPEHELHFYLVARDTLQATTLDTRQIIALAQVEADRRTTARTRWLAIATTGLSGVVGLLGVALGAYLAQ